MLVILLYIIGVLCTASLVTIHKDFTEPEAGALIKDTEDRVIFVVMWPVTLLVYGVWRLVRRMEGKAEDRSDKS